MLPRLKAMLFVELPGPAIPSTDFEMQCDNPQSRGFTLYRLEHLATQSSPTRPLDNEQLVDKGVAAAELDAVAKTQRSVPDHLAARANEPDTAKTGIGTKQGFKRGYPLVVGHRDLLECMIATHQRQQDCQMALIGDFENGVGRHHDA